MPRKTADRKDIEKLIPDDKLLSPKYDNVFKKIFGAPENVDILRAFLAAVLGRPAEELEEISVTDPHLRISKRKGKQPVLDLKIRVKHGVSINVELQVQPIRNMKARVVFESSKSLGDQLASGMHYADVRQVITVVIAYFDLTEDEKTYHHRYVLYDKENDDVFTNLLQIDILEVTKLPEGTDATTLWDWTRFFGAENQEEYDMLARNNEQIKKAVMIVKKLSANERERLMAEAQERAWRDEESNLRGAYEDGEKRGLKLGEERGFKRGEESGLKRGEESGLKLGEERGFKLGEERGLKHGVTKIVGNMLRQGFTDEQIMTAAEIDRGTLADLRRSLPRAL
jgi:predicted transposase/invertase (TIGR01784 family)